MDTISRIDRRKQEARARILEAAEQLFVFEASYEQATIREIARRADISVGAVYLHFKTKADILAALIAAHGERIRRIIEEATSRPGRSAFQRIEDLIKVFEELRLDKTFLLYGRIAFIMSQDAIDELSQRMAVDELRNVLRIVTGIMTQGIADGSIRSDMDPELRAVTFLNIGMAFTRDVLFNASLGLPERFFSFEPEEIFKAFSKIILDSLRAPGSSEVCPPPVSVSP